MASPPQAQLLRLRGERSLRVLIGEPTVAASSRTVFLVYGAGGRAEQWRLVWPGLLEAGHRVVAFDALGHGGSPALRQWRAYAGSEWVADLPVLLLEAMRPKLSAGFRAPAWGADAPTALVDEDTALSDTNSLYVFRAGFQVHVPHDHELEHAAHGEDKNSFMGTIAVTTAMRASGLEHPGRNGPEDAAQVARVGHVQHGRYRRGARRPGRHAHLIPLRFQSHRNGCLHSAPWVRSPRSAIRSARQTAQMQVCGPASAGDRIRRPAARGPLWCSH